LSADATTRTPLTLALEDGSEHDGFGFPATGAVTGEVVFTTAMTGYAEALTDPSYAGQILVFTYPLIGNYGVPAVQVEPRWTPAFQSDRIQVQGVVVQNLSEFYSHHRAVSSLAKWLGESDVPLLTGLDTRALTKRLREQGTMRGWLFPAAMSSEDARAYARAIDMQREVFYRVAPDAVMTYPGGDLRVLVVDTGVKLSVIENLLRRGATVVRAAWHADLFNLASGVDAVMLANGPGDPKDLEAVIDPIRYLLGSFSGPIFGICLGHQLLARAAGFVTYKLPYGHRGVNQPVQDLITKRCYITSQNHGFAVDDSRCPSQWSPWFINLNDRTNEGLRWVGRPVFSVQFHPEGAPGPADTEFLFDEFLSLAGAMRSSRSVAR